MPAVTDSQPPSQPASHVVVAITLYAIASSLKSTTVLKRSLCDVYWNHSDDHVCCPCVSWLLLRDCQHQRKWSTENSFIHISLLINMLTVRIVYSERHAECNKLCRRPPQYAPAPASWPLTFLPWKLTGCRWLVVVAVLGTTEFIVVLVCRTLRYRRLYIHSEEAACYCDSRESFTWVHTIIGQGGHCSIHTGWLKLKYPAGQNAISRQP